MLEIEVTSGQAGQIPVLGMFEAGETKVVDEETQERFKAVMGFPIAAGGFSGGSKCTVTIKPDVEAEKKGEEA